MLAKKKSCRYVINATGKNGETYLTTCNNKQEVRQWIKAHNSKLNHKELKIIDKHKKFFWIKSILLFITAALIIVELFILM
ncbi:hypothetical protein [Bacillus alveayuensis]|uniref:PH domain-containing protein n=1 Tax=Aeribacillus alveayuensis TaxID=279215 RepID=A0ABT9VPJ3_9BACI|nr:hypothetical protein [Bacillus alveayuensis]MDQ0162906.1 hypothetical protein [Bacillus alveayuensis]